MKDRMKSLLALILALAISLGGSGLAAATLALETKGNAQEAADKWQQAALAEKRFTAPEDQLVETDYQSVITKIYPDWERPELTRDDFSYEHYELATFEAEIGTFLQSLGLTADQLGAAPTTTPTKAQVQAALEEILSQYDYVLTQSSLIQFEYSQDITKTAVSDELTYMESLVPEAFNVLLETLQGVQDNPVVGPLLDEVVGEKSAADLRESTSVTPRQLAINEEITLLEQEFDQITGTNPAREGAIYLELLALRNEYAVEEGYANYSEMQDDQTFGRDFTQEDLENYYAAVKEYISPLYLQLAMRLNFGQVAAYQYPTGQDAMDVVGTYLGNISSELFDTYAYLRTHKLYELGSSPNNEQVSYTISMPYYHSAMIFQYNYGPSQNLNTLIHEFGHFNTSVRETRHSFFTNSSIDLAEIHSQGLELLFLPYYAAIYGTSNAPQQRTYTLLNLVWSILNGALYNEFETYAYTTPDVTIEQLDAKYLDLAKAYGIASSSDTGAEWMFWHMYHAPLYYLSYSLSAMAAATFLSEIKSDWRGAVNDYLTLTSFGEDSYTFRETLRQSGLQDIFADGAVRQIARDITDWQNNPFILSLNEANRQAEESGSSVPGTTENNGPKISLPEYGTEAPTPNPTENPQEPEVTASGPIIIHPSDPEGPTEPTSPANPVEPEPSTNPNNQDDPWNGDPDLGFGDRVIMLPDVLKYIFSGEFFSDLLSIFRGIGGGLS